MRKSVIFIALSAMMLFAVEGYAQRERRGEERKSSVNLQGRESGRSSVRSSQKERVYDTKVTTRSNESNRSSVRTSQRGRERKQVTTSDGARGSRTRQEVIPPQRGKYSTRALQNRGQQRQVAPPRDYKPRFKHHNQWYHHHYHCIFDSWSWYTWGGYNNRFIQHRYYHNRFFDSILGYYLWGTLNSPTRLEIGQLSLRRYQNSLQITNANHISYLDLWNNQQVRYICGHTTIDIITGGGIANICLFDEYGNEAHYRL